MFVGSGHRTVSSDDKCDCREGQTVLVVLGTETGLVQIVTILAVRE
jgi:hypothetical protein